MMQHELQPGGSKAQSRKRRGRGESSGLGKTSGRGHKGCNARSGGGVRPGYEGGQTVLMRRIPKRGFSNFQFATTYSVVNLDFIAKRFEDNQVVDPDSLAEKGLIRSPKCRVKILGRGDLGRKLTVKAHKASQSAMQAIQSAGGTFEEIR